MSQAEFGGGEEIGLGVDVLAESLQMHPHQSSGAGILARECRQRSVAGARDLVFALRSLLRYLHLAGLIPTPLLWAVPSVADLRDRSLPRGLDPAAVRRLLASCDRRRLVGRRDFAILLLLSRRGLRAGEVAAITLDDIDWRAGMLVVHGKGNREDTLPLPTDVGEAIVSYLRRRPRCECRALFLWVTAPRQGLNRCTVGWVVRAACDRDAAGWGVAASAGTSVAVAGPGVMSALRAALDDYLRIRRRLGFAMPQDGRTLEGFVAFLDQASAQQVTIELALTWARLPVDVDPFTWRQRLTLARGFARYLAAIDPASEVPPIDLLPGHRPRITPYVDSEAEITALMAAARGLRPALRAAPHETLIGLLAVTGARPGEALGLDRADVDLDNGVVHVRVGKKNKQRDVPVHQSTVGALRCYAGLRDARFPTPPSPAFFLSARGRRMGREELNATFITLVRLVGLEGVGSRARPRPYDLGTG